MIERYRRFVAPIRIKGDPEQTRVFALLNRLLLMLIYITGIFLVISPFVFPGNFHAIVVFIVLVSIWLLARTTARMGYLRYFSMGLVTVLWILTTGLVHMYGGLEGSPFALTYVAVVVIAGRLLGGRGGVVAMVLSFLSILLVMYLGSVGRLPEVVPDHTSLDEVLVLGVNLAVVTIFQFLAWRSEQDAYKTEHELAEKAIAADSYKTNLIARVSHELRTPLGAVLGLTDMLRSGAVGEIPKEQRAILQKVVLNAEYLKTVVDDLLDQSQLFAGQVNLKLEPFSPAEIAQRVSAALETEAKEKGIELRLEGVENLPEQLIGDQERLIAVFTNLIGNAIKYTDEGEVVTSACLPDDQHWQVTVRDTGIGIAPEHLSTIFEPFTQVKGPIITRNQGGVGLGLSIAKQLIVMMGGTITVESELGVGSTFTVTLPVIATQENEL